MLLKTTPPVTPDTHPFSVSDKPSHAESEPTKAQRSWTPESDTYAYSPVTFSGFSELMSLIMSLVSTTPPPTPSDEIPPWALWTNQFGLAELTQSLMYPGVVFRSQSLVPPSATPFRQRASKPVAKEDHSRMVDV